MAQTLAAGLLGEPAELLEEFEGVLDGESVDARLGLAAYSVDGAAREDGVQPGADFVEGGKQRAPAEQGEGGDETQRAPGGGAGHDREVGLHDRGDPFPVGDRARDVPAQGAESGLVAAVAHADAFHPAGRGPQEELVEGANAGGDVGSAHAVVTAVGGASGNLDRDHVGERTGGVEAGVGVRGDRGVARAQARGVDACCGCDAQPGQEGGGARAGCVEYFSSQGREGVAQGFCGARPVGFGGAPPAAAAEVGDGEARADKDGAVVLPERARGGGELAAPREAFDSPAAGVAEDAPFDGVDGQKPNRERVVRYW